MALDPRSKPKKRLLQKGAVQGAIVGALLAALLGLAQQLFLDRDQESATQQDSPRFPEAAAPSQSAPRSEPILASTQDNQIPVLAAPPSPESQDSTSERPKVSPGPPQAGTKLRKSDSAEPMPNQLLELREQVPVIFRSLGTTVALEFRETLGSRYAELTVASSSHAPKRCAARNAGARCEFSLGAATAAIDILAIDPERRTAQIILRSPT